MTTRTPYAGFAALIEALTFIIGFALYTTVLMPAGYLDSSTPVQQKAAFMVDNQGLLYIWNLIIYILFGFALVVLSLGLHDRLKASTPMLSQVATTFGLIWSGLILATGMTANIGMGMVAELHLANPDRAGQIWQVTKLVESSLGGGNEIAGGVWVLLISLAAQRARLFHPGLNLAGMVFGASGLLTVVPPLQPVAGPIFGLGLIAWFIGCGISLLRHREQAHWASA
ncbi:DUF4386 family protein [Saccharospirillum salsuginis]|uniref:DUF4386 family protein n=1 Tax=Saccharospirillum salsuginis TaxID=418750 RepID=A0A918KBM2_9GAMM|nr:DUF4386 family protein [Saccharospirillum salsuginis]GGX57928.1 hypothetical protein GCM10007392_27030 [Saccharospirillum salsuginis]